MHRSAPLPLPIRIGKYRLDSVLGKGGFAYTYLAYDTQLQRKVAIKELYPDGMVYRGDDYSVISSGKNLKQYQWAHDSFLKEAQTLAKFDHPNLVRIMEHFKANKTVYLVMSFVEGDSLNKFIKANPGITLDDFTRIIAPLLEALAEVHRAGILHRDIKPDNIRITGEGVPVLLDFGAARAAVGQNADQVTTLLTPGYAPVEVEAAGQLGPWTDIYSLGVVVYKMLKGKIPPKSSERLRNDSLEPLVGDLELRHFPKSMLKAVDWMLELQEKERPQSVEELLPVIWKDVDYAQSSAITRRPPTRKDRKSREKDKSRTFVTGTRRRTGIDLTTRHKIALLLAIILLATGLLVFSLSRSGKIYGAAEITAPSEEAARSVATHARSAERTPNPLSSLLPAPDAPALPVTPDVSPPKLLPSPPKKPGIVKLPDTRPKPDKDSPSMSFNEVYELYKAGDRRIMRISLKQVELEMNAEGLNEARNNNQLEKERAFLRIRKALEQNIKTTAKTINSMFPRLDKASVEYIEQSYKTRVQDLKDIAITESQDTSVQQAAAYEFHEMVRLSQRGVVFETDEIEERARKIVPDSSDSGNLD